LIEGTMGRTTPARLRQALPAALLALALATAATAGPPEVVRVRVPAARVPNWFPPGTELRGLPIAEFEALARDARAGAARAARGDRPRLIRAHHEARWAGGVLVGRSELTVEGAEAGPAPLALVPWTPAIPGPAGAARAGADGRTTLLVGSGKAEAVTLGWELRARPGSDGHTFALGLPKLDAATLILDVPADRVPEGPTGVRQGPGPGSAPDRRTWRFDGPGGWVDLLLKAADAAAAGAWVGGPTRVELDEGSARWRADWAVDPGADGPRQLVAQLDPGLEPIDVGGEHVVAFRAEPAAGGARLVIRLADDLAGPTTVTIRARAAAPAEGRWSIPAARPVDAHWTGGETVLRLGPARALAACRELAGRRVAPPAEAPAEAPAPGGLLLAFDAARPAAVAELTFASPTPDPLAEVRGLLSLGDDAPRLEARLTWDAPPARRLNLAVELPAGWSADGVRLADGVEPVAWRVEGRPGGRSRVAIHAPPGLGPAGPLALILTATGPAGRRPFALPRVRPVDARIAEELWIAQAGAGCSARPTQARGLAWIDPADLPADAFPAVPRGAVALAWRWNHARGEAEIACERPPREPAASTRVTARVAAGRLTLDYRIALAGPGPPPRTLPVWLDAAPASPPAWHAEGRGPGPIPARAIAAQDHAGLGLPAGGSAWELDVAGLEPAAGEVAIAARLARPWAGAGPIPLMALPEGLRARGVVLVAVDRTARSEVEVRGLLGLDAELAWRAFAGDGADPDGPRPAHAFRTTGPPGRLVLRTEALRPAAAGGVIREATLTTTDADAGPPRQCLRLLVEPTGARELVVRLPEGSTLEVAALDGQPVTPIRWAGGAIGLLLPAAGEFASRLTPAGGPHPGPLPGGAGVDSPPLLPGAGRGEGDSGSRATEGTLAPRTTCTIVLDYRGSRDPDAPRLRPESPTFSMPCLALGWEVLRSEPWAAEEVGPALVAADPIPPDSWSARLLGRWPGPWPAPRSPAGEAAALADLDGRVAAARPGAAAIRDWFTAWDAGVRPVVVDRAALAAAGLGPRSRVNPARAKSARGALEPLGLTVVPLGGMLLVTARADRPDRPGGPLARPDEADAWTRDLRAAAGGGSNAADRFQSVARWRDEPTPAGPRPPDGPAAGAGWSARRFAAPGWPGAGAGLVPADLLARSAWGVALALAILGAGIAWRNAGPRPRAYGAAAVLALALAGAGRAAPHASTWVAALNCGTLAAVAYWIGRAARANRAERRRAAARRMSTSLRTARPGSGVTIGLILALAAGAIRLGAAELPADSGPILALLPFDGVPDPTARPTRAVLRLADHDRLKAWAEAGRGGPDEGLVARSALHRVRPRGEGEAVVESRYELSGGGPGPAEWRLPVGGARDLAASLDGKDVPVLVRPGGEVAAVRVPGAADCVLEFRRVVDRRRAGQAAGFVLPINAVATARVAVEPAAGSDRVEVRSARGAIRPDGGGAEGALGPADRLDVRWPGPDATDRAEGAGGGGGGSVEGALLWDSVLAGDRVLARLTYARPGGTATIRLAVDPGTAVRAASIPGLIAARWRGTAERPEWVASVDPPLGDGEFIAIELWRPAPPARPGEPARRSPPRIEPLGVDRVAGVLGLRRPGDWTGRLGPLPGTAPLADEAFVKAWGELPRDRLTLAGATRFGASAAVEAAVAPAAERLAVRQAVTLRVGAGRIDVQAEATLTARGGRPAEATVRIPEALRLVLVEADGLTHWSRPTPEILRLRFDGAEAARWSVRLRGWLPVEADPMSPGATPREVAAPWPTWLDAEVGPATLTIDSDAPCRPAEGPGVTPITAAIGGDAPIRAAYRVDPPGGPGMLRWTTPAPRVDVSIRSLLTVHPASAEWAASVRCRIAGGPCDALRLKLPATWAGSARVRVESAPARVESAAEGDAVVWTIRPEGPAWETLSVAVEADRPLARGGELDFPDLVPLGQGTVETLLGLANASGRKVAPGGSPGLQPVPVDRFPLAAFPGGIVPLRDAYLVKREGWTMHIRAGDPPDPAGAGPDGTGVEQADLACVVAADGSVAGEAIYDLRPRPGPFLTVDLPAGAEAVAGAADDAPAVPLHRAGGDGGGGGGGRWSIPLGRGAPTRRVTLTWRAPAAGTGGSPIALPAVAQPQVPTRLTVYAPEGMAVEAAGAAWLPAPGVVLELERAEGLARRLGERLGEFDRGSGPGREALVAGLVDFEVRARAVERAVAWGPPDRATAANEVHRRVLRRLAEARAPLADALGAAGLDDLAQEARDRVGLVPSRALRGTPAGGPAGSPPLRRVGRASFFRGPGGGPGPRLAAIARARPWQHTEPWVLAGGALAVLAIARAVGGVRARPVRIAVAASVLAVILPAVGVEPTTLAALLAAAGLGWASGP